MQRNGTLDYARLLAAFGIVFFHAGAPGGAIGYAALPFFLMLLVVLAFPGAVRVSFPDYLKGRMQRLLVPWVIWSGVYGTLKLAELVVTGAPFGSEFSLNMILTGTAMHLWFLPFAFLTCVAVYPIAHLAERIGAGILAFGVAAVGLAVLLLYQGGTTLPVPFAQRFFALPSVCLGIALALIWGNLPLMLVVLGGFSTIAILCDAQSGLLQLLLAGGGLVLCMVCPLPASRTAQLAGTLSLGVYLAHPLVISVLMRTTTVPDKGLMMALLGCLGGLAIALGIYLIRQMSLPSSSPSATKTM